MEIIKVKNYDELSRISADIVGKVIKEKPNCVLGLATGSSPVGMYQNLVSKCKKGEISFENVTSVNLDEYINLPITDKNSYRCFMNDNLFDHVNIDKKKTFVPDGNSLDTAKTCREYDAKIKDLGGIDLQVLGIGDNGHIGFNEPSDHFTLGTHVVNLTKTTIEANARFFDDISSVPTQAITMGMGGIMGAKKVLLIINTPRKNGIANKALFGDITPQVPASILQLHKDVVVVMCEE